MNDLIHRYLDGELSEAEALALRRTIEQDPAVEAELRAWERMLGAAAGAETATLSAGFTDQVMRQATARADRAGSPWRQRFEVRWPVGLAWAATLVLVFGLGALSTRGGHGVERGIRGAPVPTAVTAPATGDMRLVRLVYESRDPRVRSVRVAGTFNDWNPEGVSMERHGDLWTAVLILPRGSYEYMYVEDDTRWVTDPLALETRDDGFGRKNAVLDLTL
jgi:hypothetical protein